MYGSWGEPPLREAPTRQSHTGNLEPWVVLGGLCLGGGMLLIALWFFCFRD